jgi:RNA recognition motif-containing protein
VVEKTDSPHDDPNIRGDAFKTLIVARLDYSADEKDLEREFGRFGPIERVCFFPSLCFMDKTLTATDPHHP